MKPSYDITPDLFEDLPGAFFQYTLYEGKSNLLHLSKGIFSLTGFKCREFLKDKTVNFFDLIHPADIKRIQREHQKLYNDPAKKSINIRYRMIDKNGKPLWVQEIAKRKKTGGRSGKILISGYVLDITSDTKYHEIVKTLRAYQHAVNESAIVSLTDTKGKIIYVNEKFIEVSQYGREELVGFKHNIIKSGHHPREFYTQLWKTISEGKPWRGEIMNRAKDGTYYWVDTVITPILNQDRKIVQYLSIRNIITRQKEQEIKLKENENRFRDIVENTTDMIQAVDTNGNIRFVNESWKKKMGYSDRDVIGKNIFQFIHPDSKKHCESIFRKIKKGEDVKSVEVIFQTRNNKKIFCEANINSRFENNKMILTRGIFRDVTETRQYKEILKRHRTQLETAQHLARLGSWYYDVPKNLLEWSDETYRIFGENRNFSPSYESFLEKIHPEDREYVISRWNEAFRGRKYDIEHRILVNGKEKWVRELAIIEFGENGNPLHCIGSVQDITERKQAVILLLQHQEQLNEAQKIAKLGSYVWDTKNDTLTGSAELFKIIGIKKPRQYAIFSELFSNIHPEDKETVAEKIKISQQHGNAFTVQFRYITPGGKIKYIEAKRLDADYDKSKNNFFTGTIQDISDLKNVERNLFNSIIETEENERARIAAELHDGVCQYLAATRMLLSSIRKSVDGENKELYLSLDKCAELIDESVEHTRHLSHQLLPQSLHELGFLGSVKEIVRLLNDVDSKRYSLIVSGNELEPESHIAANLYRIIQEFTGNSRKYSEAEKIEITINYFTSGMEILLHDNGKGFDLKKIKQKKGIGLYNMIKRIESIGGIYNFTSERGQGVLLKIDLQFP